MSPTSKSEIHSILSREVHVIFSLLTESKSRFYVIIAMLLSHEVRSCNVRLSGVVAVALYQNELEGYTCILREKWD